MSTLYQKFLESLAPKGPEPAVEMNAQGKKKFKLFSIHELNEKFIRSNIYSISVVILVYFIFGVITYHLMMKWNALDSVYFVVMTLLTVGYGDYHPISSKERLFTAFYIILGLGICSTALGAVTSMMQAHQERMDKLRSMRAMLLMKEEEDRVERYRLSTAQPGQLSSEDEDNGNISLAALQAASQSIHVDYNGSERAISTADGLESGYGESAKPRALSTGRKLLDMAMSLSIERPRKKNLKELRDAALSAYDEDYNELWRATMFDFCAIFGVLIFGMLCMNTIENWPMSDAFYWAVCTAMTVGYGDLVPTSETGKIFTIFYAIFGCGCMAKVFTDVIKYPLLARLLRNEEEVARQFAGATQSPELLQSIFGNELHRLIPDLKRNPDEMSKNEFVLLILHMMNKVEEKDIFLAAKLFDDLDSEHKGFFSLQDMREKVEEAQQRASIIQSQNDFNTAVHNNYKRGESFTMSLRGRFSSFRNRSDTQLSADKDHYVNMSNSSTPRGSTTSSQRPFASHTSENNGTRVGAGLSQSWSSGGNLTRGHSNNNLNDASNGRLNHATTVFSPLRQPPPTSNQTQSNSHSSSQPSGLSALFAAQREQQQPQQQQNNADDRRG